MNKIKIGDRVQLKTKEHTWHAATVAEMYTSNGNIHKDVYEEVAMLLLSKARRTKLKGEVHGYGAPDCDFKNKRNYVFVEFQYKDMKCSFYCSEKSLKRL